MKKLAAFVLASGIFATPSATWVWGGISVAPPPTISSVLPNGGGTTGGTVVTINGSNFTGTTAVHFGAAAAAFSVIDDKTIKVSSSPAGTGTVDVIVTTSHGASVSLNDPEHDQFRYANAEQNYVAGGKDPKGIYLGGTELRFLTFHTILNCNPLPAGQGTCTASTNCPGLFAGNGFWRDIACSTSQGPQILALLSPRGRWYRDVELAGKCNGNNFNVVNSLYDLTFSYKTDGTPITPPLSILVASPNGANPTIAARRDETGTWSSFVTPPSVGAREQIRSLGEHIDNSGQKPLDYLLVGNDNIGVIPATFEGWPAGFTFGSSAEPYSADGVKMCAGGIDKCTNLNTDWPAGTPTNPCGTVVNCNIKLRVLGIADCPVASGGNVAGKAAFQIVGMEVYRRFDKRGNSYWKLWGVIPMPDAGQHSPNGLRGLTCVSWPAYASGYALLSPMQGTTKGSVWRFDPSTAMTTPVAEGDLRPLTRAQWGNTGGGGARINAYNGNGIIQVGNTWVFGEGAASDAAADHPKWGNLNADVVSGFWVRKGSPPTFTLYPTRDNGTFIGSQMQAFLAAMTPKVPNPPALPDNATAVNGLYPVMGSTRTIVLSQFPSDAGQYLYFGGVDAGGRPVHDTAWVMRAPLSEFGDAFR